MSSDITLYMTAQVVPSSKLSVQACKNGSIKISEYLSCRSSWVFFHSSWQTKALLSEMYVPHPWWWWSVREIGPLVSHLTLRGDEQGWLYCMRLFQVTWGLYRNWWNKALGCATIGIPEAKNHFFALFIPACPHFSSISRAHSPHSFLSFTIVTLSVFMPAAFRSW